MGAVVMACAKTSYAFGLNFLFCEMGEQMSSHFNKIDDIFSEMDWYLFPAATQRMMPTILMMTQQPVQFLGFGNIPASRDTFKNVRLNPHVLNKDFYIHTLFFSQIAKTGLSYFMIFREIQ